MWTANVLVDKLSGQLKMLIDWQVSILYQKEHDERLCSFLKDFFSFLEEILSYEC